MHSCYTGCIECFVVEGCVTLQKRAVGGCVAPVAGLMLVPLYDTRVNGRGCRCMMVSSALLEGGIRHGRNRQ